MVNGRMLNTNGATSASGVPMHRVSSGCCRMLSTYPLAAIAAAG